MKERPIIFSAPMVKAILEGRKTMTRRLKKPGEVGDRLWVRENCMAVERSDGQDGVLYLADGAFRPIENTAEAADRWLDLRWYGKRKSPVSPVKKVPSIHMPRWASRINLEITRIHAECIQDIDEDDALAEGVGHDKPDSTYWQYRTDFARSEFSGLWDQIHGPGSWDENPMIFVVEFKVLP